MKGEIRIFLTTPLIFSTFRFIFLRFDGVVDPFDDLAYGGVYLLVGHYFLGVVCKKHIQATFDGQVVLLFPVAFADAALEQIAFYGPFEELLWDRDHNTVHVVACFLAEDKAHSGHTRELALGKKHRNACLAAQSFFFRKSIAGLLLHCRESF